METQYKVLSYRIELYFHDYKLAIEIDENGHRNRNIDYEIKKTKSSRTRNFVVNLSELILTEKTLIFLELPMTHLDTLNNRL